MQEFQDAVARFAAAHGLDEALAKKAVSVPRERDRGDLSLPCFPFAKALGKAPPAIAADLAAAFAPDEWLSAAEAAGPFVNFRVNRASFAARALAAAADAPGRSDNGAGKTVVIDYGSPNIAKPLLFHHLRSSVIGQALCNLHRHRGYTVVGINYLGDVGTAFGKLMVGIDEFGPAEDADALNDRYVRAAKLCADEPAKMDAARAWAKRLEDGDGEAVRLWTDARRLSLEGFARIYDRLGVAHDVVDGEQMYVARANELVDTLLAEGRAEESEGAIIIDPKRKKLGVLLLRKRDGATLYQSRDLAAAIDRFDRYAFDKMLYVVDVAQEQHFRQLFAGLKRLGYDWADRCAHVAFGQVLMGGRRTATREGKGVLLDEVLDEGERRAQEIVEAKNPDLADKGEVARAVGAAAVIFSDVGFPVRKNINFDWDEILTFDGRTGPYLQYVHASACSILRKGGAGAAAGAAPERLAHELEWELVRRLAEFPEACARACADCEPSHVAGHLYELAREFRAYHAAGGRDPGLRVLTDDEAVRAARLALVDAVRNTLATGLRLLGIEPLEVM